MIEKPIPSYRGDGPYIFVSYSHADMEVVYEQIRWLADADINVWFDEGIQPGSRWREQLAEAIDSCQLFVLFASGNAMRSENCRQETDYALDQGVRILVVYLEQVELTPGLKLSLGSRQAIVQGPHTRASNRERLIEGVKLAMVSSDAIESPPQPMSRRFLAAAALVVIIGLSAVLLVDRSEEAADEALTLPATLPDRHSVAVMRFLNLGGDAVFSDGLSERLLQLLAQVPDLSVPSRISTWSLSTDDQTIAAIANQLNVHFVLEGSVQVQDESVRVITQLIDASTDTHIWAENYDRALTAETFFAIQDDIAHQVVATLQITLTDDQDRRLTARPTRNEDALEFYLEGRSWLRQVKTPESLTSAVVSFENAIAADESYAEAYAGLCESELAWYTMARDADRFTRAEQACLEAMRLDDSLGRVHAAVGSLHRYAGRYAEADVQLRKAQELLPNDASVLEELGRTLRAAGEIEQAETVFERAIARDPANWSVHKSMGNFLFRTGRYAEAIPRYQKMLELNPEGADGYNNLGAVYSMQGDYARAIETWDNVINDSPSALLLINYANSLYYLGRFEEAVTRNRQALALNETDFRTWRNLGDCLRVAGRSDEAEAAYRRAIVLLRDTLDVQPNNTEALSQLAASYALVGERQLAEDYLKRLESLEISNPNDAWFIAFTLLHLGRDDEVEAALSRAESLGYSSIMTANDPDFMRYYESASAN